jgi:hypothetical protein
VTRYLRFGLSSLSVVTPYFILSCVVACRGLRAAGVSTVLVSPTRGPGGGGSHALLLGLCSPLILFRDLLSHPLTGATQRLQQLPHCVVTTVQHGSGSVCKEQAVNPAKAHAGVGSSTQQVIWPQWRVHVASFRTPVPHAWRHIPHTQPI